MKITGIFEVKLNPLDGYAEGKDGINIEDGKHFYEFEYEL